MGFADAQTVQRVALMMNELNIALDDRAVISRAREAAAEADRKKKGNDGIYCGAALGLPGGEIVCGYNTPLMHSASCLVMNAIKRLADIPEKIHLLPQNITETISSFKTSILNTRHASLDLEETLIALSISAMSNPAAELAIERLPELRGCEMHMTHMPTRGDEEGLRRLGINVTSDPNFSTKNLFNN